VWVARIEDFLAGCAALGVVNSLDVVDCGFQTGPNKNAHGFIPSHTKTDNFKVDDPNVHEIDTRFFDSSGTFLDGRQVTWTDTHLYGATAVRNRQPPIQRLTIHAALGLLEAVS
jgi:hypothetical protein